MIDQSWMDVAWIYGIIGKTRRCPYEHDLLF